MCRYVRAECIKVFGAQTVYKINFSDKHNSDFNIFRTILRVKSWFLECSF
jgi:hypothetical protein